MVELEHLGDGNLQLVLEKEDVKLAGAVVGVRDNVSHATVGAISKVEDV